MIIMPKTFGKFIEVSDSVDYLIISFSSTRLPIQDRWRNNSLSANFLAAYWGMFFPGDNNSSQLSQAEVKDIISYTVNELLENAVKFNYEPSRMPITIRIYPFAELLRIYVTNSIHPQAVWQFQQYLQILLTEDLGELYIRQIEHNVSDESHTESRLGYLTILNDYQVQLAWKFDTIQQDPEIIMVTTMAQLAIK